VSPTNYATGDFVFHIDFGNGSLNGPCAIVTVKKTAAKTDITADGYNKGWNTSVNRCDLKGVKKVERAIHYYY